MQRSLPCAFVVSRRLPVLFWLKTRVKGYLQEKNDNLKKREIKSHIKGLNTMLDSSIYIKGQISHADDMQQYYSSVNGKEHT